MLNESGSLVPFYIAKHDYESGLNGAGRTLLVRKTCYDTRAINASGNAYAASNMDSWLNDTYKAMLESSIRAKLGETTFYYTPGGGDSTVSTLKRGIFLLSVTEFGRSASYANKEGTALPIATTLQIATMEDDEEGESKIAQWTRTPYKNNSTNLYYLTTSGTLRQDGPSGKKGSRPAFTLPGTLGVEQNADGTYSIA